MFQFCCCSYIQKCAIAAKLYTSLAIQFNISIEELVNLMSFRWTESIEKYSDGIPIYQPYEF